MAEPRPKVFKGSKRHSAVKLENIVRSFTDHVVPMVRRLVANKHLDASLVADPTDESLLELRKQLVAAVKKGMLERQDQEELIAILAAAVWYCRLDADRRWEADQNWG